MTRKTVVLCGKGELAIRCAEWFLKSANHDLTAIVPVIPEPGWSASFRDWALANGVTAIESGRYQDLPEDQSGRYADLGVSVFYDRLFKAEGIAKFGRLINLHNGPLPRYRGMSPINWALKNGETSHGVTIHEITPGIDDGPLIAGVSYSIRPEIDEVADVYERSLKFGWTLFEDVMPRLDRLPGVEQDHASATYYSTKDAERLGDRSNWRRDISS